MQCFSIFFSKKNERMNEKACFPEAGIWHAASGYSCLKFQIPALPTRLLIVQRDDY